MSEQKRKQANTNMPRTKSY